MSKVKDETYNISDSTDWLETPLPSLAPVDSALRCQVCRDFFDTPMTTSCSHAFCSLCIRKCLGNNGQCPTCREKDDASKLRNNLPLEEMVDAFKRARSDIMTYVKRSEEAAKSATLKRKHKETEEESSPVQKRTRSGRRTQQSSQQAYVVNSEDDGDYEPEEIQKPGQVQCPICQDGFPTAQAVSVHIDQGCDGEPASKKQKARSTQTSITPQQVSKSTKRPDRLPQLHYGTVKDNVLRKKLQELSLSAGGSRQLMERRYTEWVTLWNANCDSRNPKGKGELKRELDVWERTQGGGANIPSRANSAGNIRDKDFDGSAWLTNNHDSFQQLIESARKTRAAAKTKADTSKDSSQSKAGLSDHTLKSEASNEHAATANAMPTPISQNSPYPTMLASSMTLPEPQPSTEVQVTRSEHLTNIGQPRNETLREKRPASPLANPERIVLEECVVPVLSDPASSQAQITQISGKDVGISSDMSIIRSLQP